MRYTAVGSTHYPAVNTCEKFQLANNQWTNLPNMKEARFNFNPCLFSGIIYLCGATSSGAAVMEAFSPESDTFLLVQIPVPESNVCCLYADNDLLVVNTAAFIVKFAVGQNGQLVQRSQVQSPSVQKYQNSQPVVDKTNGVFFTTYNGQCLRFNMETGVQGPTV